MRRRIDTFDMSDATDHPSQWQLEDREDGGGGLTLAFWDEQLWQELLAAREKVDSLEAEVRAKLKFEPLDAVEVQLKSEWDAIWHDYDTNGGPLSERLASVEARALAHAQTVRPPQAKLSAEGQAEYDKLREKYSPAPRNEPDMHGSLGWLRRDDPK